MVMEIIISVTLLFVGIAVLIVIHICIVGRAFRGGLESGLVVIPRSINNGGLKKLSNEDLRNLPCFDYKAAVAEKGGSASPVDCVVCLENFKVGENCKLLPNCNHSFHSQCIDSWLLKNPLCPICRTSLHPQNIGAVLSEESIVATDFGVELT